MIGLEYICKLLGVQYKDLAERIGVKPPYIQAWLKGTRKISKDRLKQLQEIFEGIPQDYFGRELSGDEMLEIEFYKYKYEYKNLTLEAKNLEEMLEKEFESNDEVINEGFDIGLQLDLVNFRIEIVELMQSFKKLLEFDELKDIDGGFSYAEKIVFILNSFIELISRKSTSANDLKLIDSIVYNLRIYFGLDEKEYESLIDFVGYEPEFIILLNEVNDNFTDGLTKLIKEREKGLKRVEELKYNSSEN